MRSLILKTTVAVMLCASVISCKKDNNVAEPLLPPSESMLMDFSNFQGVTKKNIMVEDTSLFTNWTASAVTVNIWSAIVYLNSAIPVAAFGEAFNHPAVFVGNATWERSYTVACGGLSYTCKLDGTVTSNTVEWKMYITRAGGIGPDFTDFLWVTGSSANDASSATWHVNRGPETDGRQYFDVSWAREKSLRYTLVDTLANGTGNYLEYDIIDEAGLDSQFLIQTVDHSYDISIQWSNANKNGRVKCHNWYGDLNWHCWGTNYKNVICN